VTKQDERCPHCNASMAVYMHSLTKAQIRPLAKLANAGGGPLSIADDINLTKSEYGNFAKLQYWDLAEKEGDSERGGRWVITETGKQFVKGEIALQRSVRVHRRQVLRREGPMIYITDATGGWKYKPQHIADSVPYNPQRELI